MTRAWQTAWFLGVALIAALAGYFLNPLTREPKVDTGALMATSLPDMQGQRRQIGEWRGKVLVVNFWATWCPPCLKEVPELVRLQGRLGSNDLQIIGIAVDSETNVRQFAQTHPINYPVLIGNAGAIELSRLAGNARGGLPYTIVLDRKGRALRLFHGDLTEATLAPFVDRALR